MKLIVGLGNPGEKYENNRHNVGFQFLDYFIDQYQKSPLRPKGYEGQVKFKSNKYLLSDVCELATSNEQPATNLVLAKPTTFMNKSGIAVKKIIENFKLNPPAGGENLIIAHDDLDIPFGKFHIQVGVGPELHNGIESIENHLKTKDFFRIRIGVDNRVPEKKIAGETYVLSNFIQEEVAKLNSEIFPKIIDQLKLSHQIP
ncbi:MAG: Peptidyl-tRNA hydrolase [Candidatus Roizmanbacteria bacterium GW2011_GWA2_35_19]|uniref:Peptidyl-tRNA hydrolase n=2 Tax=Candidatus Roizmaniibacteriota TaxID=1752723 RepID=A0A0G0EWM1_9BACT|nr:MAG: Peptidyl-tRNA hydrolase [Candidatus Roizmanbacteria bacterium GW2011_GWA2_35_19]